MAQYTATLYKNTGFNIVDIPDSPALVNSFTSVSASVLYLKQNTSLGTVRIEKQFDDIKNCDYMSIGNMYYFVTDIHMLNDNVCEATILEDSITSMGGPAALKFIDGWCERRHVTSDGLFENVIPENFTPKEPLQLKTYGLISSYSGAYIFVASTVDLSGSWGDADIYVGQASSGNFEIGIPAIPDPSPETTITINTYKPSSAYGAIVNAVLPGYGLYNYQSATVQNNIKKLRALGLETVLVGCYKIPERYVASVNGNTTMPVTTSFIQTLEMSFEYGEVFSELGDTSQSPANLHYGYGTYTPANKKVYSQYNDITVFSTSGDTNSFRACDIKKDTTTVTNESIPFTVFANGAPNGTPFCRPKYYEKEEVNTGSMFNNTVKGSVWANCPLVLTGASGSEINEAKMTLQRDAANMEWNKATYKWNEQAMARGANAIVGTIGTTGKAIKDTVTGNFFGAAQGATNLLTSGLDFDVQEEKRRTELNELANNIMGQKLAYEISQNIVAPDLKFTQDVNSQLFLGNSFFAYTLRLSDADLERFDKYLTLYGYATSEPLTTSCFTGRVNYNFVQASGVSVEGTSSATYAENNSRMRRINCANMLQAGVRVWHTAPTTAKRFTNPIAT